MARKIGKNLGIQFIGKALSLTSGLIAFAILAKYLGPAGYGQFSTVLSFLQFFGILIDFGLSMSILSLTASLNPEEESKMVSNIITIRLISGVICFIIAPIIALAFPYSREIKIGIALSSVSYLAIAVSQVLGGVFQKHLAMHKGAIAEISGRIVLLGGVIIAKQFGAGLLTMILMLSLGNVIQCLVTLYYANQYVKLKLRFDHETIKTIFKTTWPIALSISLNLIYLKTDVIFLSIFKSPTEVGLYSFPYKILDVITIIPNMFMGLMLPLLAFAWTNNQFDDFKKKLRKASEFMILISIPLAFGTFAIANDIMVVIGGPAYAESGKILAILTIAAVAVFFSALYGYTIVAMNMQKKTIIAYGFNALISVPLYLILIQKFGGVGAAWTTVIVEVVIAVITAFVVFKKIGEKINLILIGKTLAASSIMYLVVNYADGYHVILRIILGAVIYSGLAFIFKMVDKDTVLMLKSTT